MEPSYTIPDTFRYSYSDDIREEFQQLYSRLEAYVTIVSEVGRSWVGTKIGKGSEYGTEIIADGGETNPKGVDTQIRHIFAKPYKEPNYLTRIQMINVGAAGNTYTEKVKKNQMATAQRNADRAIVQGALGPMRCGQDGMDTVNLDPAYSVAVDYVYAGAPADSGLTPAKISEVNRLFATNEVTGQGTDNDTEVFLAIGSRQKQDMLNNPLIMNNQLLYASLQGLREGQLLSVQGMTIKLISDKILPFDPVTKVRTCFAWVRDAIYFNKSSAPETRMDIQEQFEHRTQIVTYWANGAGRMDELGVMPVYCSEDTPA